MGVNYSYRLFLSANLLFLDWDFWAKNHHDLERVDSQVFCPAVFHKEHLEKYPAPDIPDRFVRFYAYMCAAIGCKHRYDYLSDNIMKGLMPTSSSILPAINLAYLANPHAIALIGVELDSRQHFWDDPRWPEIDRQVNNNNNWSKLIFDYAEGPVAQDKGKFRSWFPNAVKVRRDVAKAGRFLKKKGIKAYNCATNPPGKLYGWERKPLEEVLCKTRRRAIGEGAPFLSSVTAQA